jgi:hypothetical protein
VQRTYPAGSEQGHSHLNPSRVETSTPMPVGRTGRSAGESDSLSVTSILAIVPS